VAIIVVITAPSSNNGNTQSGTSAPGSADRSVRTTPSHGGTTLSGRKSASDASTGIPAAESGLLPWQLAQPLSREVAVSGSGPGSVVVLGGLSAGSQTTATVQSIQVPAGTPTPAGALSTATHDAAGAVVGGRILVFGGGGATTIATVQAYPLGTAGGGAKATVVGQLPQPRSDATAVTVGATAYVVGGYDGTRADPEVLATTNGSTFHGVGSLTVPVRYAAVAAVGRVIYVFGGERVGAVAGAVDDIQRIDTRTGQISVVGHLPQAVSGASAVTLGGVVYVAGGTTGSSDVATIYAFDARTGHALVAGQLMAPVANAAITPVGNTAWLIGGESSSTPTADVQMLQPNAKFGTAGAPGAGSPYFGEKLLIADRGNNRMLVLDDTGKVTWTYPNPPSMPPPPGPRGFYFPDDAFFIDHGTAIVSNQEENETIVQIGYPSGKLLWSYGHVAQPGSAPGYLHEPDDAYLLKNGDVTVADADNCRILVISPAGSVVSQVGTTGSCVHNPPTGIGGPNGDTPLADGNFLISETKGSYISEYTPTGSLVWTTHLDVGYPSDPQQIGPNLYMCADYSDPGGIVEFNRGGQILYTYRAPSGINRLNQPSLAELLPSGVFMANDDYRDRMAAIDPTTQALVWDYGVPDVPGTSAGYLNTPDGFDILNADGSTPTHPYTG
jgi:N-acetylneuraminic acid mutarotase